MEDLFIQGAAVRVDQSLPWYRRWWLQFIKPRCAIPAPKLLSLRDWRLGLANRVAQVTAPRPCETQQFTSRFPAPQLDASSRKRSGEAPCWSAGHRLPLHRLPLPRHPRVLTFQLRLGLRHGPDDHGRMSRGGETHVRGLRSSKLERRVARTGWQQRRHASIPCHTAHRSFSSLVFHRHHHSPLRRAWRPQPAECLFIRQTGVRGAKI
jgi:hypothetical protein